MMSQMKKSRRNPRRDSPLEMRSEDFRRMGRRLVDRIAEHLDSLAGGPVTPAESPETIRAAFATNLALPEYGTDPESMLSETATLLFHHSLFNGHPRFWGYITSSAAPIGVLAELLAAAVNANTGAWKLAPAATEIEAQTVRWIAELIGYPSDAGGVLVSGGNMANFAGFLAARASRLGPEVRVSGLSGLSGGKLLVYASKETHTWIHKAADLFGLGTDAIRWIDTDSAGRLRTDLLEETIEADFSNGNRPFLVVGTAGSVSTGSVDPLPEMAAICREFDLWFHVDGAYGALAAQVPGVPSDLAGLSEADSVAVDPHKWLYAPLEAGCVLVRRAGDLRDAFSYHPPYYHFDETTLNYFDFGMQNSRGFRSLKVWLALRQVGRSGYLKMIGDDIRFAEELFELLSKDAEFEACTRNLSIATFRYVPCDLRGRTDGEAVQEYLNELNRGLLDRIEQSGDAFLSNAVIGGKFLLRACIVNFRTSREDVQALPGLVSRLGRQLDSEMRSDAAEGGRNRNGSLHRGPV